jgi:20S proteasome alpha/beta subunit
MTVCVAMLCDKSNALVLVADKMVGVGYIETEPDIKKLIELHKDWSVMFAGDDITPVSNVVDRVKAGLASEQSLNVQDVISSMQASYEKERDDEADDLYLSPRKWTREQFRTEGKQLLPETLYADIEEKLARHELEIELLVAGFDKSGVGHIFCLDSKVKRGIPQRCDMLGFCAVGGGSVGATYMMYYRKCSPQMKIREALYYAIEAKYFGEYAGNVGMKTDAWILQYGKDAIPLDDETTIEKKFMEGLCEQLSPRELKQKRHIDVLNSLPELRDKGIEELTVPTKKKRKSVIHP